MSENKKDDESHPIKQKKYMWMGFGNYSGGGQSDPIGSRRPRAWDGIFRGKLLHTKGIKICRLFQHGATLLCFEAPFHGCRPIGFDISFDPEWRNDIRTSGRADCPWAHVDSYLGDSSLRCFDNRHRSQVASRRCHTGRDPAPPARTEGVNNVPPTPIRIPACDLRALSRGQGANRGPDDPGSKATVHSYLLRKHSGHRGRGRGCRRQCIRR